MDADHWHRRAVVCGCRNGSAWSVQAGTWEGERERGIQGFVHGRAVERAFLDIIFELFVL